MLKRSIGKVVIGSLLGLIMSSASAWTISESYDKQSVGQRCGSFWADNADTKVTNERSSSGSHSCKMSINQGGKSWGGGFVLPSKLKRYDEYWMRFRLFVPNGFDYGVTSGGSHLKFVRVTTKDPSGTPSRWDWQWLKEGNAQPYAVGLERDKCTTNCWQYFGKSNGVVRGVWETWEAYIKFDSTSVDNGGQGISRLWKNGKLIGELTARPTLPFSNSEAVSAMIFSYWNGSSPATQHLYFEDLVATNNKPANRDQNGNAYIGVGNFVPSSSVTTPLTPPLPPSGLK